MDFSISNLLSLAKKGVEFAETFVPFAQQIGGNTAANAINIVGAITDTVTNITQLITDGEVVASSSDADEIKGYAERLAVVNDALSDQINKS